MSKDTPTPPLSQFQGLGNYVRLALLLAWALIYAALAFGVRRVERYPVKAAGVMEEAG